MPIDNWLGALPQPDHSATDSDLLCLAECGSPFLTDACVSNQIERLSGHLDARHKEVRRQVIAYSLYTRQVDAMLQSGPRAFCGGRCPTPPAGCCNYNHYVVMNITDVMNSQNSPTALHMAHTIGLLQQQQSGHNGAGRTMSLRYCSLLAEDGCTLRLVKSPRCAHYMYDALKQSILEESAGAAKLFLAAIKRVESSTISSPDSFASQTVIDEGALLFLPHQGQA